MALERCTFWDDLATEHRAWLSSFHPQYLGNWEKALNGSYEAGLCEAAVRRMLQNHSISVEHQYLPITYMSIYPPTPFGVAPVGLVPVGTGLPVGLPMSSALPPGAMIVPGPITAPY
jgi:hypothetical protein